MTLRILDIWKRRDNYSTISTSKRYLILTSIGMHLMIDTFHTKPPNITIMSGQTALFRRQM